MEIPEELDELLEDAVEKFNEMDKGRIPEKVPTTISIDTPAMDPRA